MDSVRVEGRFHVRLEREGRVLEERSGKNFLTELGEAYLADRLSDRDESDGDISHGAIGSSTGQSRTSTTLATETGRVALDSGYPDQGTGGDDNDVLFQYDIPAGTGDGTVSEAGLFTAVTVGTMINYFEIVPAINKGSGDNLVITVTFTVGAS